MYQLVSQWKTERWFIYIDEDSTTAAVPLTTDKYHERQTMKLPACRELDVIATTECTLSSVLKQSRHNNDTAIHLAEGLGSEILTAVDAGGDADFLPAVPGFFASAFLSAVDASRLLMKLASSSLTSGSGLRQYVNEL